MTILMIVVVVIFMKRWWWSWGWWIQEIRMFTRLSWSEGLLSNEQLSAFPTRDGFLEVWLCLWCGYACESQSVVSDSLCSLPGSSVHGILQARILQWEAIPFSRGSSWAGDQTWVSHIAGFFTSWDTRELRDTVTGAFTHMESFSVTSEVRWKLPLEMFYVWD